jgi:hypothetical protein
MSKDIFADHLEFFTNFGIPTDVGLAWGLIDEEVNKELFPAVFQYNKSPTLENKVEVADAVFDSIYVLLQLARAMDIPVQECWDEVHRSNMAKMVNGEVIRNSIGKVQKPPGWTPPNLWDILHKYESQKVYSSKDYDGISNVKSNS